jgi:broad specificity phosphatase PhoE
MNMDLFFVRHGRTEMNRRRLLQGQGGYGLLPEGREDARRAAEALAGRGVGLIYSSDQQRARETAAILKERLRVGPAVRVSRALREIHFGRFSGRPGADVRRECPAFTRDASFVFPGGESYRLVQHRALAWLARIERRRPAEAVAVVTHGGWLRTLLVALRRAELDRCLEGSIPHGLVARVRCGRKRTLRLLQEVGIFDAR